MADSRTWCCGMVCCVLVFGPAATGRGEEKPQYEFGEIRISAASAEEPRREQFSLPLAAEYLEQGTLAWNGARKCVACHTNGTYMVVRPALSGRLGAPPNETREHFVSTLETLAATDVKQLKRSTRPAQVLYTAAGLAEWDAHVTGTLSPETERALELMFEIQLESGTWGTLECWPPYESDAFHEATVAAMAVAAAPGWLEAVQGDPERSAPIERLKNYLRSEPPPHDYGRTLLLWASTRMPDLVDEQRRQELIDILWSHQRDDGGWSIRTFAAPEAWGNGNRAQKIRSEPDFDTPASDGHQTGLAIIVLREAGIPADDPRIQKGIDWLLANQRESGRWWTRSLNTDSWHFITYSGTAFPVLALSLCDALP
jgi:squalene-hopene/tetraprenyl-beta-curcumene cyclase